MNLHLPLFPYLDFSVSVLLLVGFLALTVWYLVRFRNDITLDRYDAFLIGILLIFSIAVISKYGIFADDISQPAWVDPWHILDLEREAALSLVGEPLTQARMTHVLQTGKPLRN